MKTNPSQVGLLEVLRHILHLNCKSLLGISWSRRSKGTTYDPLPSFSQLNIHTDVLLRKRLNGSLLRPLYKDKTRHKHVCLHKGDFEYIYTRMITYVSGVRDWLVWLKEKVEFIDSGQQNLQLVDFLFLTSGVNRVKNWYLWLLLFQYMEGPFVPLSTPPFPLSRSTLVTCCLGWQITFCGSPWEGITCVRGTVNREILSVLMRIPIQ